MNKAEERVSAGARFLDAILPGWEKDVDLDALDISDPENCILGQLYGAEVEFSDGRHDTGYWYAVDILRLSREDSQNYGFDGDNRGIDCEDLQEHWANEINQRL